MLAVLEDLGSVRAVENGTSDVDKDREMIMSRDLQAIDVTERCLLHTIMHSPGEVYLSDLG